MAITDSVIYHLLKKLSKNPIIIDISKLYKGYKIYIYTKRG